MNTCCSVVNIGAASNGFDVIINMIKVLIDQNHYHDYNKGSRQKGFSFLIIMIIIIINMIMIIVMLS